MKNIHFWIVGILLFSIAASEILMPIPSKEFWTPAFVVLCIFPLFLLLAVGREIKKRYLALTLYALSNFISYVAVASILVFSKDDLPMVLFMVTALTFILHTGNQAAHLCLVERVRLARYRIWVARFMFWIPSLSIAGYLLLQNTSQPEVRFFPVAMGALAPLILHKFIEEALKDE